jgi:hypothetical protein
MKVSLRTIWLVVAVVGMIGFAHFTRADDAQNTFDQRFEKDLERVRKTPGDHDDIELAKTLLDTAKTTRENPEIFSLLCENAYRLVSKNPRSYHIAIEAMNFLGDNVPELRTKCLEKILVLQMALYGDAGQRDKVIIGEETIYTLLELSDAKAHGGDASGARLFLLQASKIAKAVRSDIIQTISEKEKTLSTRIRAGLQLQKQLAALQADPKNIKLREKLIRQLVVREENLPAAKSLLTPDVDEHLQSYVPIALKNPKSLPPTVAYEMSQWYRSILNDTSEASRPSLLMRIRQYLNVYLMKHTKDDKQRLDAAKEFHKVELQLVKLGMLPGKKYWSLDVIGLGLIADPKIDTAILRARNYLWGLQRADGTWANLSNAGFPREYSTPLIAFALIQSGVSPSDKRLVRTLKNLAATETDDTLSLAFRCCLWNAVNFRLPGKYITELRKDALKLARGSIDGGFGKTCSLDSDTRDNDAMHTQYAILGVAMGVQGGVKIPRGFWVKSMNWWRIAQNPNGGWGRTPVGRSRHNPTAAGAVSMLICLNQLNRSREIALNHDSVEEALGWLNMHFNDGKNTDPLNYLYTLSRLGIACKAKQFANTNWFKWASDDLLWRQQNNGAWKARNQSEHISTALGILVLCTARGGR